jgi:hypothetical protein
MAVLPGAYRVILCSAGCRRASVCVHLSAREESARRSAPDACPAHPREVNPKGAAGSERISIKCGVFPTWVLRKGEIPGAAGCIAVGLSLLKPIRCSGNGKWDHHGGNTVIPCGRAKLRRGESQERCGWLDHPLGFEGSKPSRG